jgi:hypothetical protein
MGMKILFGIMLVGLLVNSYLYGIDTLGWIALISTSLANILLWRK